MTTAGIGRSSGAVSLSITLLPAERSAAFNFMANHQDCAEAVVLTATPTGVGDVVKAVCRGCGEIANLTDYGAW